VDFGSGYVTQPGVQVGVPMPMNEALAVPIEESRVAPEPARLDDTLLARAGLCFTSAKLLQPARKTRRRTLHHLSFHRRELAH
jgi:hypothetical protein